MSRWWREPLVHFLAFGLLVVGVQALRGAEDGDDARVVEVSEADIERLRRGLADLRGRPPTDAELDAAVHAWVREEVLARAARDRGLDAADPVLRSHLARKMTHVLAAKETLDEPGADALRAFYEAHREAFRVTTRVTVRHLFAGDSVDRADELLAATVSGALDDLYARTPPPPGGPVLRGRTPARLAELLGEPFAEWAANAPLGEWARVRSTRGWHVARVEKRREGRVLDFVEARDRVRQRWRRARLEEATEAAWRQLRDEYEVRGWPR